jgi:hypothetical protein
MTNRSTKQGEIGNGRRRRVSLHNRREKESKRLGNVPVGANNRLQKMKCKRRLPRRTGIFPHPVTGMPTRIFAKCRIRALDSQFLPRRPLCHQYRLHLRPRATWRRSVISRQNISLASVPIVSPSSIRKTLICQSRDRGMSHHSMPTASGKPPDLFTIASAPTCRLSHIKVVIVIVKRIALQCYGWRVGAQMSSLWSLIRESLVLWSDVLEVEMFSKLACDFAPVSMHQVHAEPLLGNHLDSSCKNCLSLFFASRASHKY